LNIEQNGKLNYESTCICGIKTFKKTRSEWTEREQCNIKYLHFQVRFYQF